MLNIRFLRELNGKEKRMKERNQVFFLNYSYSSTIDPLFSLLFSFWSPPSAKQHKEKDDQKCYSNLCTLQKYRTQEKEISPLQTSICQEYYIPSDYCETHLRGVAEGVIHMFFKLLQLLQNIHIFILSPAFLVSQVNKQQTLSQLSSVVVQTFPDMPEYSNTPSTQAECSDRKIYRANSIWLCFS